VRCRYGSLFRFCHYASAFATLGPINRCLRREPSERGSAVICAYASFQYGKIFHRRYSDITDFGKMLFGNRQGSRSLRFEILALRLNPAFLLYLQIVNGNSENLKALHKIAVDFRAIKDCKNALQVAARCGQTELVQLFLQKGADIEAEDREKQTPLLLALANNGWQLYGSCVQSGLETARN
jgi:ankyrin repeat protein